jgi:hypothetical protein
LDTEVSAQHSDVVSVGVPQFVSGAVLQGELRTFAPHRHASDLAATGEIVLGELKWCCDAAVVQPTVTEQFIHVEIHAPTLSVVHHEVPRTVSWPRVDPIDSLVHEGCEKTWVSAALIQMSRSACDVVGSACAPARRQPNLHRRRQQHHVLAARPSTRTPPPLASRTWSRPQGLRLINRAEPCGTRMAALWHDSWHDEPRSRRSLRALGAVWCRVGAGGSLGVFARFPRMRRSWSSIRTEAARKAARQRHDRQFLHVRNGMTRSCQAVST